MFTLSPAAAEQVARAAEPGARPLLRVAAKLDADGEMVFGMGFDDERDDDLVIQSGEVTVLIAPPSQPLLSGALLDFVEVQPGEYQFVFSSVENAPAGGCGGGKRADSSGGCGNCGGGSCA